MKMLKKTLALLLAAAIAMCISGTFVFAETTTALTDFPTVSTANADCYVYMQTASAVANTNYTQVSTAGVLESKTNGKWSAPRNYTKGFFVNKNNLAVAHAKPTFDSSNAWFDIRTGDSYARTNKVVEGELNYGVNIALANADNTALTSVSSGYLMLHTDKIYIEKPTDEAKYYGFGLATQSEYVATSYAQTQAWAYVGMSGADSGLKLRAKDYGVEGEFEQEFDLSDWIKPGDIFSMKLLVDLGSKTYNVYINDRPVATALKFNSETVKSIALCLRGESANSCKEPTMAFRNTKCYPMDAPAAAQYKQAAMERAFDRTFTENGEAALFYTNSGSADYEKLFADNGDYRSFKCEGVEDFKVDKAQVGESSYYKVYYTGTGMSNYSYDNLEYVYVSKPMPEHPTATVSGTYELIGGKGIGFTPVVITALYTDENRTQLVNATCTDGANGVYSSTLNPAASLDYPGASAFIWGGRTKLVPLFPRVDFE